MSDPTPPDLIDPPEAIPSAAESSPFTAKAGADFDGDLHAVFSIKHPKHGTASCDLRAWPEFEALGWIREASKRRKK